MSARAALLVAFVVLACGSSPSAASQTAESSDAPKSDEPDAGEVAASKAEWNRLVRGELVWRRPDLDASCDETRSGHFMPSSAERFEERVLAVSRIGCKSVTFVLPGSGSDGSLGASFPGGAFCCPRDLPPASLPHTGGGKSCEQAQDEYVASHAPEPGERGPDRPSVDAYGAILNKGSYFKHCSVSHSTTIVICAAILDGRAVGVTVRTTPVEPGPADCIAEAVVGLTFPKNSLMDVTKTHF
jgi:hypothetical protein